MSAEGALGRIQSSPEARGVVPGLMLLAADATDEAEFLRAALSQLWQLPGSRLAAVVRAERGQWQTLAWAGERAAPPEALLADALDQESACAQDGWCAAPLGQSVAASELFLRRMVGARDPRADTAALAAALGAALALVRRHQEQAARIGRLEAVLQIAASWNQNQELESLLTQMAETSTRLLGAERASIFLWDRPNKLLVGRPALGVPGGELQIPDNRGIVGQVIQSGQLRRVDGGRDAAEIDRQVDERLGYRTRTLLCVPLRGRDGRLLGAFELINKQGGDFTPQDERALVELAAHAATALENTQQYQRLLESRNRITREAAQRVQLIGTSPAIEAVRSTVGRVAPTDLALLVLGENGTGKEVVSQLVHYLSPRRHEPFLAVNCAALVETLLESELFGHEKGAFTDAHESRAGKFELASGGTLLLDEIGDLSPGGQAKLLRALEEKVVVRVGGSRPIHTDARVIAATNQDLGELVRRRRFREDLYFRLNVVTVQLPPLRDRADDVLPLAEHFLAAFSARARRKPPTFTAAAQKRLRQHPWPGNVRELRNLMERLAYLLPGDRVDAQDLSFVLAPGGEDAESLSAELALSEATRQFQCRYIAQRIRSAGGNMSDAAERLGLHRSNLYRKMRQLDMPDDQ